MQKRNRQQRGIRRKPRQRRWNLCAAAEAAAAVLAAAAAALSLNGITDESGYPVNRLRPLPFRVLGVCSFPVVYSNHASFSRVTSVNCDCDSSESESYTHTHTYIVRDTHSSQVGVTVTSQSGRRYLRICEVVRHGYAKNAALLSAASHRNFEVPQSSLSQF